LEKTLLMIKNYQSIIERQNYSSQMQSQIIEHDRSMEIDRFEQEVKNKKYKKFLK
jgi:hypothetical protein